jgi:hypothetical protein
MKIHEYFKNYFKNGEIMMDPKITALGAYLAIVGLYNVAANVETAAPFVSKIAYGVGTVLNSIKSVDDPTKALAYEKIVNKLAGPQ